MRDKIKLAKNSLRYLVLAVIILILIAFFGATSKNFFSIGTLMNFLRQNTVLFIASLGMMLTMLVGGLDLSIGTTGALAAMTAALVIRELGPTSPGVSWIAFAVVILIGALVGTINGLFIGYLKIAPFMATLAMQSVTMGMCFAISGNDRIIIENETYTWLGKTSLKIPIGETIAKLPVSLILVVLASIFIWLLLKKSALGRKIYAVGGNRTAATCSGIDSKKTTLIAHIICSIMMSIAAIIWGGRTSAATPTAGTGLEFSVLTAAILGGCSLAGGIGTLGGVTLGVVLLGIINTGLGMVDTPPYVIYWIQGVIIIAAVYIDIIMIKERVKKQHHEKAAKVHSVTNATREQVMALIRNNEQTNLELRGISKAFPGVQALNNVNLKIERGKVHAIMGENGAGKSTLMKILTGVYSKDEGEMLINGIPVDIRNPIEAQKLGISIIYQEFALIPFMSVAQNVYMGKELRSKFRLLIDRAGMRKKSAELLKNVNLSVDPDKMVSDCRVGQQQMIEIGKAIGSNSWVLVMDEPTAAITEEEKTRLFSIIRELKSQGVAVVYISHRMAEIFEIADDVTVLRDGQHIITLPVSEVNENTLIKHMVGRELNDIFNREKAEKKEIVLEVRNLSRRGVFEPVNFTVRAGEVLGFSGLIGAGRTEIMRCLFGLDKPDSGEIFINGKKVRIHSSSDAIKAGLCLISEDRRREGIVPPMTVRENITIPSLDRLSSFGIVNAKADKALAKQYTEKLNIKTPTLEQLIRNLSGGNQQKVCLAKWLAMDPKVIIMDEPTRGIDVGAKAEIHKIIENLAKDGMAIILISSELPEIIGASDRILVLCEGKQTGEFMMDETVTQEVIMARATGLAKIAQENAG